MPAVVVAVATAVAASFVSTAPAVIAALGTLGAVAAGAAAGGIVALGASKLLGVGRPDAPQFDAVARGALINTVSNVAQIPVIYGTRKVGGPIVFKRVGGANNEHLYVVMAISEGPISAINTVYLDDVATTDARFAGLVTLEKHTGVAGDAASSLLKSAFPGVWTDNHLGGGVAYLALRLTWSENAFPRGEPAITCDVDGRLLYDPRDGLTKFSRTPALAVRDYLTHPVYGRAIPSSAIDDASFAAEANHHEESVTVPDGAGGSTLQARYTCDGLLNPDDGYLENVRALLTSCRAMLIYSGGKYKIRSDKAETPIAFAFTEHNITGAWQIQAHGKRGRFNRIRARFFNPARKWQPDFALQDSSVYRAADNGILLETEIALPFTADIYRAQQIAQMELKQSRFGLTARFNSLIEGLRCEVGDVVEITHTTPGWSAKPFRVVELDLLNTDEVTVTAREYDASVYTLDALAQANPQPSTSLPDPFKVAVPGAPSVTETVYETTGSAGVKSRAVVSWGAPADAFVTAYEMQYRAAGAPAWSVLPVTRDRSASVDDLAPGRYEFRVRAYNTLGVASSFSATTTAELYGLTQAPADITGFAVQVVAGQALVMLDKHPALDVRIGGRIVLRWSPLTSAVTWNDGILLSDAFYPGDSTSFFAPLLGGTYLAKAQDSSGLLSMNAASFVLTDAQITGFTTLATLAEHPAFGGAKTNLAAVDGGVQLVGATLWDDLPAIDGVGGMIDSLGGIVSSGTYTFANRIDLGVAKTVRLFPRVKSLAFDTQDLWDARIDPIDIWGMVDGNIIDDAEASLEVRVTNDDPAGSPAWGPWHALPGQADYSARAFEFRVPFSSGNVTHNRKVTELSVAAKQPV